MVNSVVKARALSIVRVLKKMYPVVKTELTYTTPFQFLSAVILSAQCTDKHINNVTPVLWKKYPTIEAVAGASVLQFQKDLANVPFYRNKAKAIVHCARIILDKYAGTVPSTEEGLVELPGIGYKTAHVILGELYGIFSGIPTDTHVRRFAYRFELSKAKTLEGISKDLEALVPKKDWKYVNNGFVLYGRHRCPARKHDCKDHPLTKLYPKAHQLWPKAH